MLRWIRCVGIFALISAGLFAPAMAADEKKSDVDRAFLDLTAMHHHDGIEMARLAEKKATRDDVKAFAEKTRTGQEKDLREATAAREKLFKRQPEAERLTMGQHTMDRAKMQAESQQTMARLNKAEGASFDHEFVTSMSKHHRDAVQMATYVAGAASDGKVRDLAKRMAAEQTQELAELSKLDRGHAEGQASPRTR